MLLLVSTMVDCHPPPSSTCGRVRTCADCPNRGTHTKQEARAILAISFIVSVWSKASDKLFSICEMIVKFAVAARPRLELDTAMTRSARFSARPVPCTAAPEACERPRTDTPVFAIKVRAAAPSRGEQAALNIHRVCLLSDGIAARTVLILCEEIVTKRVGRSRMMISV